MKLTNLILKYFAVFCLLTVTSIIAKSQSVTATILSIEGSVQITRTDSLGARLITLNVNDNILAGDVIKTNGNGRLVLKLSDNSQAIISEKTTVEIKDLQSSPRTIFNVIKGKTRIKIEKLGGKPNPYQVTTPTTVIAVRGTEFDVFVKDNETKVYVTEGEVSVTGISAPQQVILTPGNFTQVKRDRPPMPPARFTPQQNDKIFRPRDSGNPQNRPQNGQPPTNNPSGRGSGNPPTQPNKPPGGGQPPRKP